LKTPLKNFLSFADSSKRLTALFGGALSCLLFLVKTESLGFFCSLFCFFPLLFVRWRLKEEGFFIAALAALGILLIKLAFLEIIVFALFYLLPILLLGRFIGKDLFYLKPQKKMASGDKKNKTRTGEILPLEMRIFYFLWAGGALFVLCLLPFVEALCQKGFFDPFLATLPEGDYRNTVRLMLPYLPALIGLFWGGLLWLNLLAVRFSLERIGIRGSFRLSSEGWTLPSFSYGLLALMMAGALFAPDEIGLLSRNWLPFAICPFLIEGLILALQIYRHFLGRNKGEFLFWGGIVFLGYPLLLIVVLGVFEPWSNLRRRLDLHHKGES
jgi:hypothetical protein